MRFGDGQVGAAALEFLVEASERLGRGEIDVEDGPRIEDHQANGLLDRIEDFAHPLADEARIGEEEGAVHPVDQEARDHGARGFGIDAVITRLPLDPPEDRVVRPGRMANEVQGGEADRHEDASRGRSAPALRPRGREGAPVSEDAYRFHRRWRSRLPSRESWTKRW